MDWLRDFFLGVLIEVTGHYIIRKLEEKEKAPRRVRSPKHMRKG